MTKRLRKDAIWHPATDLFLYLPWLNFLALDYNGQFSALLLREISPPTGSRGISATMADLLQY